MKSGPGILNDLFRIRNVCNLVSLIMKTKISQMAFFKSKIVHCVMFSITITEKSIINLKMKIIENFNEIYATKHGTIFAGGNAVVVFKTSVC